MGKPLTSPVRLEGRTVYAMENTSVTALDLCYKVKGPGVPVTVDLHLQRISAPGERARYAVFHKGTRIGTVVQAERSWRVLPDFGTSGLHRLQHETRKAALATLVHHQYHADPAVIGHAAH